MNLLCDNYQRAADNREMVRLKQNIEGYLYIEQLVRNWPRSVPLPEQLMGRIPTLSKHENF
uniref:Uncharacterized protein n=1 Tax=viral metagenome TaxID=1070528 RepID=A0A6M3LTJ9_9ZZZZ